MFSELEHGPQHTSRTSAGARALETPSRAEYVPGRRSHFWTSGRITIHLVAIALLWVGCTKAELGEVRKAPTGYEPHEALAIVVSRDSRIAEDEIVDCISTAINEADPTLRVVLPVEFRHLAFPNLAPEAAPQSPHYLTLLLEHPQFQDRMSQEGIRYLISVSGETEQQDHGGIFCGGGYGGGGCLGVVWWDRESRLVASVFDFKQGRIAGEVRASASGRPWFAVVLIFPLGLPAATETRACSELGEAVSKFIAGGTIWEPSSGIPANHR